MNFLKYLTKSQAKYIKEILFQQNNYKNCIGLSDQELERILNTQPVLDLCLKLQKISNEE